MARSVRPGVVVRAHRGCPCFALETHPLPPSPCLRRRRPAPVIDEPAPTTTVPETRGETGPPVLGDEEWRRATWGEPWVRWLVDVEGLSDGGFVAVASEPSPWSVIWSPDGREWLNGDPHGLVPAQPGASTINDHTVVVVADRVVVFDPTNAAVLVGHPQTGEWTPIGLQTTGLGGTLVPLAVASNDREVLVIHAATGEAAAEMAFWVVDPAAGTSTGPMLPGIGMDAPPPVASRLSALIDVAIPSVGWVDDHWIVMAEQFEEGRRSESRNSLWISSDATAWTEVALPDDGTYDRPLGMFGGELVTSPFGAIVHRGFMGGGDTWYSSDGIEWQRSLGGSALYGSSEAIYSESLGFIVASTTTAFAYWRPPMERVGTSSADSKSVACWNCSLPLTGASSSGASSSGTILETSFSWLWSSNPLPHAPAPR